MERPEGFNDVVLGLFIVFLALFVWRFTRSFIGWDVLSLSGSAFIITGWCKFLGIKK